MSSNLTLIWTSTALADLQRLRAFIAQHNPHAAKRAAQAIKQAGWATLFCPPLITPNGVPKGHKGKR